MIQGETKYTALKCTTIINCGNTSRFKSPAVAGGYCNKEARVFKKNLGQQIRLVIGLDHNFLGPTKRLGNGNPEETGESPTATGMRQQAGQVIKRRWKARVKTASQVSVLMQATEDDLSQLERFQQDALGSIGLKVCLPSIQEDWARPQC